MPFIDAVAPDLSPAGWPACRRRRDRIEAPRFPGALSQRTFDSLTPALSRGEKAYGLSPHPGLLPEGEGVEAFSTPSRARGAFQGRPAIQASNPTDSHWTSACRVVRPSLRQVQRAGPPELPVWRLGRAQCGQRLRRAVSRTNHPCWLCCLFEWRAGALDLPILPFRPSPCGRRLRLPGSRTDRPCW